MERQLSPWASAGLYLGALTVGLYPLIDLLLGAWPFRLGEALWRYGFVGVASGGSLPVWILSVSLLVGIAYLQKHATALRVVGVLALSLAVLILPVMALFALDLMEVAGLAQAEQARAFKIRGVFVETKYLGAALTYTLLGWGSWRTAGSLSKQTVKDAGDMRGMLFGASPRGAAAAKGAGGDPAPADPADEVTSHEKPETQI